MLGLEGTLEKPCDLLLGRRTYDLFAGYWPHVPPENPIGAIFDRAHKCVLTRGLEPLDRANSHRIGTLENLRSVKASRGPGLVLWGSSTLYPGLLDAHLIDRLLLLICPIALGKGKRLFGITTRPSTLMLKQCRVSSTGVLIATYERPRAYRA